jgi:hypothetical protein
VFDSIFVRAAIGLPTACTSLDEAASEAMVARLDSITAIVQLLQDPDHRELWMSSLVKVADLRTGSAQVVGRATRICFDGGQMDAEEVSRRLGLAGSPGSVPAETAGWIAGFLGQSATILIHEDRLWKVIDDWIIGLGSEVFTEVLPLLRRAFGEFPSAERRQIGERVKGDGQVAIRTFTICERRADKVRPILDLILGAGPE